MNRCPNCKCINESTSHITRCPDAGRRDIFKELVKELLKWMKNEQTEPELLKLICDYFNHHGKNTMQSLLHLHSPKSQYRMAAMIYDKLGWDNFLEGRIAPMWVEHRVYNVRDRKLKRGGGKW